jgi:aspartate racemase
VHIGLIVGIGPAATDYYYRAIIDDMRSTHDELHLTMAHADTPTLLSNQESGNANAQVRIYRELTDKLQSAGAEVVAITSIAGHFCIDEFAAVSSLPIIDMRHVIRDDMAKRGLRRVGVLGTRVVMDSRFYGALGDADVVPPPADIIAEVHDTYIAVAQTGLCSPEQRSFFHSVAQGMVSESQLDAVLLAGTDLALAFNGAPPSYPVVDCAKTHALSIAAAARR